MINWIKRNKAELILILIGMTIGFPIWVAFFLLLSAFN